MNPFLISMICMGLRKAAVFLPSIILTRVLTLEEFGVFSLISAILTFSMVIGVYGIPDGVVAKISNALGAGRSYNKELNSGFKTAVLFSFITGFVLFAGSDLVASFYGLDISNYLKLIALVIPLEAIILFSKSLVRSFECYSEWFLIELVRPFLFIVPILFVPITLSSAVSFFLVAYAIGSIVSLLVIRKFFNFSQKESDVKGFVGFVLPIFIISSLVSFVGYIDIILLGLFTPVSDVGIYQAVLNIVVVFAFVPMALNKILLPRFSRLAGGGMRIKNEFERGRKFLVLVTVPLAVVFVLAGRWILAFVYGDAFTSGYEALVFLIVGYSFVSFTGSKGQVLIARGETWIFGKITALWVALDFIATMIFVPFYGMDGMAFISMVSLICLNLHLYKKVSVGVV